MRSLQVRLRWRLEQDDFVIHVLAIQIQLEVQTGTVSSVTP
ncbi:MAG: hypothetical protein SGI72_08025 [Planctomycetota bacterium]|nr:hypothetical protein [Planctomycetota bacterium]